MEGYWRAFTVPLQRTLERIISFVPRLIVAVILFSLFYVLAGMIRRGTRNSLERLSHIPWAVRVLIARLASLLTLLVGLLVALSAANVNVTTVLTSLGVAGFALGFALKEILENFLSGILLLFARPFEVGDQVTLGSFEGTVKDIQIRTTTLQTYSDETVTIPNSDVYTHAVVNHTKTGRRRYSVEFDTSLSADIESVQREALRVVHENPDIAADPAPSVRLRSLNGSDDTLNWRISYWAAPTKASEVKTISETLQQIKQRLYDAGVPTPSATSTTVVQRHAKT